MPMRLYNAIFALMLAASSLPAQTNAPPAAAKPGTNATTSSAPPPALTSPTRPAPATQPARVATPEDILPVATNAPRTAILKRIKDEAANDEAVSVGVNELGAQISQLEPTGQYVERYVRIPAGSQGEDPKVIRFYVPVFTIRPSR